MHSWLDKGLLAVATLVFALSGLAWAAVNDEGCSDATLTGAYGFRVVRQAPALQTNGAPSVSAVVGMKHCDGAGTFTQVDFVMMDGVPVPGEGNPITGFHF